MSTTRKFAGAPAVRASIPLWIGIYGPSGSGKTYSALRLARGIQSVVGGKIAGADTENGRMLHYATDFAFMHYPFDPPFDPLAYLAILEQMQADGITVAIIDSASHEHEGQGGVIEMHEAECERLVKQWRSTRDKVQMSAWAVPKQQRRKLIQGALRLPMHVIWCFRAKEKLEVRRGKEPMPLGFMPIAAEELVYEMAMTALLMPGAQGVPTWKSDEAGERQMIKLPHWARAMLRAGALDEQLGAALATWARGDAAASATPAAPRPASAAIRDKIAVLIAGYEDCQDPETFERLEGARAKAWKGASPAEQRALKTASDAARARATAPVEA